MTDKDFDDIRPYRDNEINAAMHRIVENSAFGALASFVFPDEPVADVRRRMESFDSVSDFQVDVMDVVNRRIIADTITGFFCSGLDRLSHDRSYLYVSNHRDIMLDSSLLQSCLYAHGFSTTEITFGANLMMSPLIIDIGRSNKMFRVERPGGSIRDFYQSSLHLSNYIRYVINERHESVWIAQRNGRTKDGNDTTDQGIVKMFGMSDTTDKVRSLATLNIVPVAVSYEWEPCDVLKALELYQSQYTRYTKKPGEDLNSILTGITQQKGKVHFEVCEPLSLSELRSLDNLTSNEYNKAVAALIDHRIHSAYKLTPNNYIAHDMRYGSTRYSDNYTAEQWQTFKQRVDELNTYAETCDIDQLRDIFLGIYSNPVDNKQ